MLIIESSPSFDTSTCFECGSDCPSVTISGGFCSACNTRITNDLQLLSQDGNELFFEGIND